MGRRTILSQLLFFQIILLLVTLGLTTTLFIQSAKSFYYQERRQDLEDTTRIFANLLESEGFPHTRDDALLYDQKLTESTESRITLIRRDGVVVADSLGDAESMANHAGRPEVAEALTGRTGYALRYSATAARTMMYSALPIREGDSIVGVIRVSFPGDTIRERISSIYIRIALVSLAVLILAAWISWITARRFSGVVRGLKEVAAHYAQEEFARRLEIDGPDELREMGEALNSMGVQLKERLDTIREQKQELQTILNSMNEPVIFTDRRIHVIKLNAAAEKLFGHPADQCRGKNLLEVFRNSQFHDFAEGILAGDRTQIKEILLGADGEKIFEVHGTPLEEVEPGTGGLLLVLHDISERKRLEIMRKDFVASVSHELKTPVTNIKGYVETLLYAKNPDPSQTENFLNIISRHTNRLSAIIDDLLTLSEVEKTGTDQIRKEEVSAQDLLSSVRLVCAPGAEKKGITLKTRFPEDMILKVHPLLAEQAVLNLVDNAVKYSPSGTEVSISAYLNPQTGSPVVSVADQGPGISAKDIERIFERFYTVDKARSRQAGGTGLGLSIVKHIALVHGGAVSVESPRGGGSLFRIHF